MEEVKKTSDGTHTTSSGVALETRKPPALLSVLVCSAWPLCHGQSNCSNVARVC